MEIIDKAIQFSEYMNKIETKEELDEFFNDKVAFNDELKGYRDWLWHEYQSNLMRLEPEKPSILKEDYAATTEQ